MHRCQEISEQASDFIDQQQSWQQRLTFRLHLFICRNCRCYIAQLKTTIASVKQIKQQAEPILTKHHQQLASQLREQAQRR